MDAARQTEALYPRPDLRRFIPGQLCDKWIIDFRVTGQHDKGLHWQSIADKPCGRRQSKTKRTRAIFAVAGTKAGAVVAQKPFQDSFGLGDLLLDFVLGHGGQIFRRFSDDDW